MKNTAASVAAMLLATLPSLVMAADQAMGRLFFTPEQRARMDEARQQERSLGADAGLQGDETSPSSITLNGVVVRSDGKAMLWINNREHGGAQAVSGGIMPGRVRGQVGVVVPGTKRTVSLKVGQSIDMSSGRVDEAYRRPAPQDQTGNRTVLPQADPAAPPADAQGAISVLR